MIFFFFLVKVVLKLGYFKIYFFYSRTSFIWYPLVSSLSATKYQLNENYTNNWLDQLRTKQFVQKWLKPAPSQTIVVTATTGRKLLSLFDLSGFRPRWPTSPAKGQLPVHGHRCRRRCSRIRCHTQTGIADDPTSFSFPKRPIWGGFFCFAPNNNNDVAVQVTSLGGRPAGKFIQFSELDNACFDNSSRFLFEVHVVATAVVVGGRVTSRKGRPLCIRVPRLWNVCSKPRSTNWILLPGLLEAKMLKTAKCYRNIKVLWVKTVGFFKCRMDNKIKITITKERKNPEKKKGKTLNRFVKNKSSIQLFA